MTVVLSVFNQAGGVGKTTLVQNLAYHLGQQPLRVLAIDIDPQSSLTTFMGLNPSHLEKTIYQSLIGDEPLHIHRNIHGVDLVPANMKLADAEIQLVTADLREFRMKDALEPLLPDYDIVLVDCPPSLGLLSIISLVTSTHVLVPIETQFKAYAGTDLLLDTYRRITKRANRKLQIAGFVPTMYNSRCSQDSRTYKAICSQLAEVAEVFDPIARSTAFADASENFLPLALYQPRHPSVAVLEKISRSLSALCQPEKPTSLTAR
jgi:chromosome partitioning protein